MEKNYIPIHPEDHDRIIKGQTDGLSLEMALYNAGFQRGIGATELNPDLLKVMQEAETTKEDDLKKVKEAISEQQIRIYFVFKHPETGEEMSSKLYTPLELLDTDLSIINERTCVCDCKPVGETNVVECNCEDYYQDFEFHSYHVEIDESAGEKEVKP